MEINNNDEIEIDLIELAKVLLSKIWIIILVTALGLGMAAGYTMLFIKPVYKSTAIIYVLTKTTSITSLSDIQLGSQLAQDYNVIITSRPVLQNVIDDLGLDMTVDQLKGSVAVTNPSNTRFLQITVSNNDAFLAKKIVDDLADVSSQRMAEVMETQAPNIMDYGQIEDKPSEPNLMKNSLIGAVIAFVLVCGIIVVMYLLDDSIKTAEDVEKYLGLNTLGIVPLRDGVSKRKTRGHDPTSKKNYWKKLEAAKKKRKGA